MSVSEQCHTALNRLAKWRMLFAGWQLGSRPKGDPESDAVRDHREVSLLLRCEVNAMIQLLVAKGVFTSEEFEQQLIEEARHLQDAFEKKFPGVKAPDSGLTISAEAAPWMSKWKP